MKLAYVFVSTRTLFVITCIVITAFSLAVSSAPANASGELNVFNWGHYINPKVLKRFSEKYDVDVHLDLYQSNQEMLAKIQAGATGYDLVFPSVWMEDVMLKQGLLYKTNINQYPGYKNINPATEVSKEDPHSRYCLPYAYGSVGIIYNKKILGASISGWKDLFALANNQGKKISLLPDPREVLAIGFIMTDHSVNDTDPRHVKEAADWIIKHIKNVVTFTYAPVPLISNGDIIAGQAYVGDAIFIKQHPELLKYVIPEEGGTKYQENVCVLKSAPHKKNAKKFLEFYTEPKVAALNVSYMVDGTPNMKAYTEKLIPKWIINSPVLNPPTDILNKLQLFNDIGPKIRLYQAQWERIRAAAAKVKK